MTVPSSAIDSARYRLDPDSPLPLESLLLHSETSLAQLARRCGYANLAKGLRRLQALAQGDLQHIPLCAPNWRLRWTLTRPVLMKRPRTQDTSYGRVTTVRIGTPSART